MSDKEYLDIPLWLRNLWTTDGQKDLWLGYDWTPTDKPQRTCTDQCKRQPEARPPGES